MRDRAGRGAPSRCGRLARLVAGVALTATALSACQADTAPTEQLAEAFRATVDSSFAFEVSLDADASALAGLGDDAAAAASTLRGVSLSGVVDGRDTALELVALGGTVAEVRQVDGVLYVRAGIVEMFAGIGLADFDSEQALLDGLVAAGASTDVLAAVEVLYDGGWVGFEGGLDVLRTDLAPVGQASDGAAASPAATAGFLFEVLGTDLEGFFERFVEVTDDAGEAFTVDLLLRDLLRASARVGDQLGVGAAVGLGELEDDLAVLPRGVPAVIGVADGVVERLLFDVAAALRRLGVPVDGTLAVAIELGEHGAAGPVGTPGEAFVVARRDVEAVVDALTGA